MFYMYFITRIIVNGRHREYHNKISKPFISAKRKRKLLRTETTNSSRKQVRVTKTPLHPLLYNKTGVTGVYICFLFFFVASNYRFWVLVRTASLRRF